MLTFSVYAETPLQVCPTYSRSTLRRTIGGNTDYWEFYHQTNTLRRVHICQRRALFVPTTETLPEEYSPDMVYSTRKTTITDSNGTEIPKIHIEDDLRHLNSAKKVPAELPAGATWTGFTDFSVIPVNGTPAAVPSTPSTKTSESTDEEMPQRHSSASTSTSGIRDEWTNTGRVPHTST